MRSSKLLKLKEWVSVADAARHLSISFGEDVSPADIHQLALEGQLAIAVHLVNGATVRCWRVVEQQLLEWELGKGIFGEDIKRYKGGPVLEVPDGRMLQCDPEPLSIDSGVWDLALIGAEKLDVLREHQRLTNGPPCELHSLSGAFLRSQVYENVYLEILDYFGEDREGVAAPAEVITETAVSLDSVTNAQRQEGADESELSRQSASLVEDERPLSTERLFYPRCALPPDAVFVVRTQALRDLEERIADDNDGGMDERHKGAERKRLDSALVIIAALAREATLDLNARGASKRIVEAVQRMGATIDEDTVRGTLPEIRTAVERRTK